MTNNKNSNNTNNGLIITGGNCTIQGFDGEFILLLLFLLVLLLPLWLLELLSSMTSLVLFILYLFYLPSFDKIILFIPFFIPPPIPF